MFNWTGSPARPLDGDTADIAGTGLRILKEATFEMPADGEGFCTVTEIAPPALIARSEVRISAVNWPEFTNLVTRLTPFQSTSAPGAKLLPSTVSVKPLPPRVAEPGLNEAIDGSGYCTVTFAAVEVPPPGADVCTVTGTTPAVLTSDALIVAES